MKKFILFFLVVIGFTFTSCIEIIDDLSFNADGSGSLKYSVNLSSSKSKINSLLALDSIDGKKVPTKDEIAQKIEEFKQKLMKQEGISNVEIESDFSNYLFKLKCDFANTTKLQNALKNVASTFMDNKNTEELKHNWIQWEGKQLSRSIPEITLQESRKIKVEDQELLKKGTYTSITRFQTEIEKFDNPKAVLAKNKMAVMIKTDAYSLINKTSLLDNKIYLAK